MRRQSEHFAEYAARLDELQVARPRLSRASARARRSPPRCRRVKRKRPRPGRAIRTARRSIRAPAAISGPPRPAVASRPAPPTPGASTSPRRARQHRRSSPIAVSRRMLAESVVAARPERWGDAVLARKEVPTSYHLSVVLDDALQGITHVVRGQDLEAATDLHVLLQDLLGLPTPRYRHHPLIARRRRRQAVEEPFSPNRSRSCGRAGDLGRRGKAQARLRGLIRPRAPESHSSGREQGKHGRERERARDDRATPLPVALGEEVRVDAAGAGREQHRDARPGARHREDLRREDEHDQRLHDQLQGGDQRRQAPARAACRNGAARCPSRQASTAPPRWRGNR